MPGNVERDRWIVSRTVGWFILMRFSVVRRHLYIDEWTAAKYQEGRPDSPPLARCVVAFGGEYSLDPIVVTSCSRDRAV
jgi:hypothetical protein